MHNQANQVMKKYLISFTVAIACSIQSSFAQENEKIWDLASCIDYALEQNIQIKKSRIALEENSIDIKSAKAALFPNLSFSSSHNVVNRPFSENNSIVDGSNIISTGNKTSYNGNYGLNASWTLYNGGKRLNTLKQEQLNNRIASFDLATSENSIEESILQIYIQILYAAESVKINQSTLAVSEAQRNRGKQLLEAGSIAQSDYAQLEAQCSDDNYQVVTAEATLQDYKLQLKQLLELDGEEEMQFFLPELDDTDVIRPLIGKAEAYQMALAIRPEIEASKLNLETSALNIDIARAGYMPTLSLSAGIGTNHTNGSDFTFSEQVKNGWNNSIGLTLSVPIFSNRQTKSAVQKAKLQKQSSELDLINEQKTLFKTIENLWLDANSARQKYVAASDKLRSTQTSYDLICEQFDLGMKNTVELLTEKNNLLAAKQEQLQAKYIAILNAKLLLFYTGDKINL